MPRKGLSTDVDRRRSRAYYKANRKRCLEYAFNSRWKKYGLEAADVERMRAAQGNRCKICRVILKNGRGLNSACVDHDHYSGAVRAILCGACNRALGLFDDDPILMGRALAYVEKHAKLSSRDMAKNNSSISGVTKAIPGGAKKDASFTKRSFADQKMDAGRKGPRENSGPRTSANAGASVSDDKAGTRSRADLPPETKAMKAPEATLPSEALDMASPILPVPGVHDDLMTVCPWDFDRDRKLGKQGS